MALEFYSGLTGSTFGQLLDIIQFLVALHRHPGESCDSKQAIIASSQILAYSQQSPTITYKYKSALFNNLRSIQPTMYNIYSASNNAGVA